ncbi:MAG: Quino(hemo)protein alcohol dehydrogenase, PQQ-dependent, partial [uncultured Gemmatimonadaceae bacterium]
ERARAAPRLDLQLPPARPLRRARDGGVRGGAAGRRRRDVRDRAARLPVGARRRDGEEALAVPAPDPDRRRGLLRQREPRRGGRARQGVHGHAQRLPRRPRRAHGEAALADGLRRRTRRGERHAGTPRRQELGAGRQLGRGVRRARAHRRDRRRDGEARVAPLHRAAPGRAGKRDVAGGAPAGPRARRRLGARRRDGVDHRDLRSGARPGVLGHGQPLARVRRRRTAREQPVHELRRRARPRRRRDPLALPAHAARRVGLRRGRRVDPVRAGWATAARPLRPQRLPVRPRPGQRTVRARHALRARRLGGHRFADRARDGATGAHRQRHAHLPRTGGREGVESRKLQPADRPPVRARHRAVRALPPCDRGVQGGAALPGLRLPEQGRGRVGPREGVRSGHRARGVVVARGGAHRHLAALHGGRDRVLGRAVGHVQRARRAHGCGALAVPDGQRHPLQPGDLQRARKAVRRGAGGLGRMARGVRAAQLRRAARGVAGGLRAAV